MASLAAAAEQRNNKMLGKRTSSERILSDHTSASLCRVPTGNSNTRTLNENNKNKNNNNKDVHLFTKPSHAGSLLRTQRLLHKAKSARTMIASPSSSSFSSSSNLLKINDNNNNNKNNNNRMQSSSLYGFLGDLVDTEVEDDYNDMSSVGDRVRTLSSSTAGDYDSDSYGEETESLTGSVDLQMALSPLSIDGVQSCNTSTSPLASTSFNNQRPSVGMAKAQGPRQTMEDRVIAVPCGEQGVLCAIYDGHGGDATSERLCNELHERVLAHGELEKGRVSNALVGAFKEQEQALDSGARCRLQSRGQSLTRTRAFRTSGRPSMVANDLIRSGSTATVVVIDAERRGGATANTNSNPKSGDGNASASEDGVGEGAPAQLHVCWLGDSRAVLSRAGKAVELTRDHRASDPNEKARVIEAGGQVDSAGRMFGDLALSRAFGNFFHKWQQTSNTESSNRNNNGEEGNGCIGASPVTRHTSHITSCGALSAIPETVSVDLTSADEFVCVASDGIWDTLSNQQVVDLVHTQLSMKGVGGLVDPCARAARAVVSLAIERGSNDNVSVVVAKF